jgi:hypothetical protein
MIQLIIFDTLYRFQEYERRNLELEKELSSKNEEKRRLMKILFNSVPSNLNRSLTPIK